MEALILEKANEVIPRLGSWLTLDKEEAIKATYGMGTFYLVKEVYSFAVNYEIDWSVETHQSAIDKVKAAVKYAYPFLTEESIQTLANCFAVSWK
ncbi:hypothetical protein ACW9KT_10490 [Hymenobacter sp. HD11105]